MAIKGYKTGDMLDKDTWRRKDRILFDLPIKHTGLKIHEVAEATGFNLYKQLIEDCGIPLDTYNGSEIGDIWTFEDEDNYVTFHGITAFSLSDEHNGYTGYHPDSYEHLVPALDKLYDEVSDEWVRPARSVLLGHGEYHSSGLGVFPRSGYDYAWNAELGHGVLANTEFEVEVWSEDFPTRLAEQY